MAELGRIQFGFSSTAGWHKMHNFLAADGLAFSGGWSTSSWTVLEAVANPSADSELLLDNGRSLKPHGSKIKDQVLSWLLSDFKMSRLELDELQAREEVQGRLKVGGLNMLGSANNVLRAAFLRI